MSVIYQIVYNGEKIDIVATFDDDRYFHQLIYFDNIEGSDSDKSFTTILDSMYAAIDEICEGDESGKTTLKRDIKLDEILNYETGS